MTTLDRYIYKSEREDMREPLETEIVRVFALVTLAVLAFMLHGCADAIERVYSHDHFMAVLSRFASIASGLSVFGYTCWKAYARWKFNKQSNTGERDELE